jgi:hypothetical protein
MNHVTAHSILLRAYTHIIQQLLIKAGIESCLVLIHVANLK